MEMIDSLGEVEVKVPLAYGGHALYVRKCMTGEQVGEDFWDRHLDGIILTQQRADYSLTVEVVAIGPRVGKPCTKEHYKHHERRCRCMSDVYKVGDMLLCPNDHPTGIQVSPLNSFEYFIEETVPIAIWREPNESRTDDCT